MKTIAINVPPDLADAFEKADERQKKTAELFVNSWLSNFFSKKTSNERLFTIMQKATEEAKTNGFNDIELDELLKADD